MINNEVVVDRTDLKLMLQRVFVMGYELSKTGDYDHYAKGWEVATESMEALEDDY